MEIMNDAITTKITIGVLTSGFFDADVATRFLCSKWSNMISSSNSGSLRCKTTKHLGDDWSELRQARTVCVLIFGQDENDRGGLLRLSEDFFHCCLSIFLTKLCEMGRHTKVE